MAQVIKLKRSAVAGKTPQTSSLQLGELAVNTTDGKIYLHRSSSSDDSIQSVLTTDATITGSLKLSGSQHISGSTNVMDDLTYGGNLTASLGSTSSFDRITSVGTSSIGFLIASGSNFATFTNQTSSFASGSDVQQILDESGSYLVDADTGSLGKVTLVSDITSSITSTASFGKIFGDGSDLDNVADPAAISGSFQGGGSNLISGSIISTGSFGKIFGDGSSLSNVADPDAISGSFQGGGSNTISGSLISTASFGKLELVNSHGFVRSTETGSFASGSDLHQFLAESSSYVVESETGSFASGSNVQTILDTYASGSDVQGILDTYASGSDLQVILAESSSYVTLDETGSFASGSDLHQFLAESASYVVDSDTGSLHQVLAESSSYLNNDTTSSFGAVSIDSTLFVQGDITTSGSVIAQQFRTEFVSESIIFASGSTKFGDDATDRHRFSGSIEITGNVSGSITSTASFGKIFGDGGNLTNVADPDAISGSFQGGGSNTISGSILSTGSFGRIVGDTISVSNTIFASGSDLQIIQAESASYVVSTNTGSYASGSDLHQFLAESSSYVVESETGSFASGSNVQTILDTYASGSDVQGILDTYASGSDLQVILAESSSYVVESETGSFVVNSQTSSFASGSDVQGILDTYASGSDLQVILAESASYVVSTNTGSFLQNADTASFQSTIITSSLEITGSQTFEGTDNFINFKSEYSGSKITKWEMGKNSDDDFKINRYGGSGSFLDQPISIASSSGITTIKDQLVRTGGVTFLQGAGSTTDGVGVYNDMKVGIGTGTTAIGDEKFLVAGDTGITGSLFVSSSITTSEIVNNTGTLKVSQSVSDGDIEISVNDGGSTINAITIDASATGRVLLKNDNQRLYLGAGNDLYLNHDGTNSYVSNETGHLNIINYADDKELRLYSDNGSGGTTPYLTLDGSITKTTLQKDISGSLGTTGSFDRLEGVTLNATISPFASGSDVSQIQALTSSYATGSDLHQILAESASYVTSISTGSLNVVLTESSSYVVSTNTGSYASGSDVQVILAESASYLVDADTGSLGLLTLGNNITGSITSTGSFGRINAAEKVFVDGRLGIGTESPAREFNIVSTQQVTSEFTSTNAIGNLIDLVHENSADGHNGFRFYDEGTQRMGLLHVQNGTRGYIHISNTYVSGSEIVSVDGDNQNVIIGNHASKDEKLFVDGNVGMTGDLNVSGSITANEYIVNSSVTNVTQSFSSGSTIFGDSIDDTHKFTGSLEVSSSIRLQGDNSKFFLSTASGDYWTHIGAHRPKLVTAGVERFRVTSAGHVVFNEEGNDMDFRIESDSDINAFKVDASTNTLAIGSTPDNVSKLKVAGDVGITGSLFVSSSITTPATGSVGRLNFDGVDGHTFIEETTDDNLKIVVGGDTMVNFNEGGPAIVFNESSRDLDFRIEGNNDTRVFFINGGTDNVSIGHDTSTFDEKFLVAGNTGITGSLNVSGSITSNQTPNVHSLSGSLHVSGGIGGTLHLSSSTDTPMIQFHQSASNAAVLLQTDEYGATLWKVKEYSGANHSGVLVTQTFTTSTQDAIRIRGGGNGDNGVDHYLGQSSYMLTDLGDTTTAYAKIDSSGLTTSGSVTASNGATIGNTETGSFTLSELNVIGTGLGLSLGTTSGTAGIRIRDNRASNDSAVVQRSDGRLSLAGTENSWGSSGIEITSTGRVAVGGTTFGRNDGSLIERFFVHGSAGITGSLNVSGSITTPTTGSFGRVNFDGVDGHTFIQETADDTLKIFVGGEAKMEFDEGSENIFMQANNYNFRDASFNSSFKIEADNHLLSGSLTSTGSFGNVKVAGNLQLFDSGDNTTQRLMFGNARDMTMYHDGTDSKIDNYTGTLKIINRNDDGDITLETDDGSGGITSYIRLDGSITKTTFSQDARVVDSKKIGFGNADDLQIYHDGTNSHIVNTTGNLHISSSTSDADILFSVNDGGTILEALKIDASSGGDLVLPNDGQNFHMGAGNDLSIYVSSDTVYIKNQTSDADMRLQVNDGGSNLTAIKIDASETAQVALPNDNQELKIGAGGDLRLYHNATDSYITNQTGNLNITVNDDDKDIILKSDDGSGGTTAYLTLDGSTTNLSLTPPGITHLLEANTGTPTSTYAAPLSASLVIEDNATPTKNSIVIKTHAVGEGNVIGALKFVSSPDGANYNWNGIEAIAGASGKAQDLVFYTSDSNTGGVTSTERLRITENQITASIASTASFGKIVADQYSLATLAEVSGGLTSTGSFGRVETHLPGNGASLTMESSAGYIDAIGTVSSNELYIQPYSFTNILRGYAYTSGNRQGNASDKIITITNESLKLATPDKSPLMVLAGTRVSISGSVDVSGSILPAADNNDGQDLGSSALRWNDVYATQTTIGAVFETGLRSKGIGKEETGTIVVWRNGGLVPCDKSEDTMVMGVVKQGKDEPIVMGAEPVLVTGDVKEGDFITTSTKQGHGKKLENGYLLKKEMFGKVIAQALEDSSGESSLIKCMIRKM